MIFFYDTQNKRLRPEGHIITTNFGMLVGQIEFEKKNMHIVKNSSVQMKSILPDRVQRTKIHRNSHGTFEVWAAFAGY